MVEERQILDSAELYNPQTEQFMPTGRLRHARDGHTATLLANGQVLMAGGWGNTVLDSAELYDPNTGIFTETGTMTVPRSGFTATLLPDGRVLLTGGYNSHKREFLASAELYDAATGTFTQTGEMHIARSAHTATFLADGRVLITGGGTFDEVWNSAELYDPALERFIPVEPMGVPRYKHAAELLLDGRVLLVGGSNIEDWEGQYSSAELYNPETSTFLPAAALDSERFKLQNALAVLGDGQVLIAGGSPTVELYDPLTDHFSVVEGAIDTARFYATATKLVDGRVLIIGGYGPEITGTALTWIFTPGT
jgi:hypothetical protein